MLMDEKRNDYLMYDQMATEAMNWPGAKAYEFHDYNIGYHVKFGK